MSNCPLAGGLLHAVGDPQLVIIKGTSPGQPRPLLEGAAVAYEILGQLIPMGKGGLPFLES